MKKITILLNGNAREVSQKTNLAQLLEEMSLSPKSILVERNGEAVLREQYEKTRLKDGDHLEFIRVVAGG